MAIERLFLSIKQDIIENATNLSDESTKLLKEGKIDEAQVKLAQVNAEFTKVKAIDDLIPGVLQVLQKSGIEQPTEEYLARLVAQQLEPSPSSLSADEPAPSVKVSGEAPAFNAEERTVEFQGKKVKFGKAIYPIVQPLVENFDDWQDSSQIRSRLQEAGKNPATLGKAIHVIRQKLKESGENVYLHSRGTKNGAQYKLSYDEIEEKTKTPRAKKVVTTKVPTITKEKGERQRDLSQREEKLAIAMFLINSDRTGFENADYRQIVQSSYADIFEPLSSDEKKRKMYSLLTVGKGVRENVFKKLKRTESGSELPARLAKLTEWLKDQQEYSDLSPEQLIIVGERGISFEDFKNKNFPEQDENLAGHKEDDEVKPNKLTQMEVEVLSAAAIGNWQAGRLEIKHQDDRSKISAIQARNQSETYEAGELTRAEETLKEKLRTFIDDKSIVFSENADNEDAQYLLAFFAGLQSPEELDELFPKK